jgi:chorismate mutase
MAIRGIRGATTCNEDSTSVLSASKELLSAILAANPSLSTADIASILFTVTHDLQAVYPAMAARQLGWTDVPLMCANEINVPNGLPRCVRILIHWNTELPQASVRHVYMNDATTLRPDLTLGN